MPDHDLLAELEAEIGIMMRRVRRVLAERAQAVDPELPSLGYSILLYLAYAGPQRASQIVDTFGTDKGAVSRQVQLLQELGFVTRKPDSRDRRAALLELSSSAAERLNRVGTERREVLAERLGDWKPGELENFVSLLHRYNSSLDAGASGA